MPNKSIYRRSFTWESFEQGRSLGTQGSEGGIIVCDEEHPMGARVTLEKDGHQPYGITCGIYGLMFHTVFASHENEALAKYEAIKQDIGNFFEKISTPGISAEVSLDITSKWCEFFTEKY